MRKLKKVPFLLMAFYTIIAISVSFAAEKTVNTEAEFLTALSDETITVINLGTDINLQADGAGDNALVINRPLTIKGGTLTSRRGGIVLGADVTFENITLSFANLVRNGIFANGNTLTLNGVKNGNSSATSIYLFCGGVTDYIDTNTLPETGNEGKIIIRGNNTLGDIFAGSFSDTEEENEFSGSATIIIEDDVSGTIGNIYAHGAYESRGEGTGDVIYPDSEKYKVLGGVNIELNKRLTIAVDGSTGTNTSATFSYSGDENVFMPTLTNIGSLSVKTGDLSPKSGSNFDGENIDISVINGTRLNLSEFSNSLEIRNFTGGGELVLGQEQTLTILGEVTGNTSVGIGGIFNNQSTEIPTVDHAYIKVPNENSEEYAFTLIPYNTDTPEILEKDENGNWKVQPPEENIIIIKEIDISSPVNLEKGSISASLPVSVTYQTEDDSNGLDIVPIEISINDNIFDIEGDTQYGYTYSTTVDVGIEPFFSFDSEGNEALILNGTGDGFTIPEGTYKIKLTIPAENMEDSVAHIINIDLIVGDSLSLVTITIPTPKADLVYTGEEQIGILEGEGYSLSNNKGTDAGEYVAVATLLSGFEWEDKTTESKNIPWNIERADGNGSVSIESWTEGESSKVPVPESNTNGIENVSYKYKLITEDDTTYTDVVPTNPGKYKIKATFPETLNYNEVVVFGEFEIFEAHTHNGGTATCTTKAVCDGCGQAYGQVDENNHNYNTEWKSDKDNHWHECVCGDKKDLNLHIPGPDATETTAQLCTTCKYVIKPELIHTHTGGTATCTEKAICTGCGQPYGELNSNRHSGTTEIRNAIEATYKEDGYTGDTYYKCCDLKIKTGKTIPKKGGSSGGGGGGSSSKTEDKDTDKDSNTVITNDRNRVTETVAKPEAKFKNNSATLIVTKEIGEEIVNQAIDNDSDMITIKPEINGFVAETEVSVLKNTIEKIKSKTDADLVIDTPVASVLIPRKTLNRLPNVSENISVLTKKHENKFELEINVDGEVIERLNGIKVTIPYDDLTSGIVAVIENEYGTREVIRKTIAKEDEIIISLNGSKKLKLIDNSKDFNDVKENQWHFNAVKFVSSREIFGGTSSEEFSPDTVMTRGMVAQVLHNIENNPKPKTIGSFYDVSKGSWYENAILWAADENIISGYGEGLFGPKDAVSREQLAVMLWRYSGSPGSNHKLTHFIDKESISEYAKSALAWANENGIIKGKGAGILDPKGKATRAEVAQMLNNMIMVEYK